MKYFCPTCQKRFLNPMTIDVPKEIVIPGKEHLVNKKWEKMARNYCPYCWLEFIWRNVTPCIQEMDENE